MAAPTLAERVNRDGPLPDHEVAAIGREVLDALAVAHGQGIIHRDVKPANVMVADNGRVQLADFGIASIIDDPKVTSSGNLAGSPSYMAPEQAHNRPAGAATDLWGLGATLYFAVEGAPPFEKDGAIPTLTSVVADEPRPMERATTLAPLLSDLLQKEPQARPTVEEVRRRLAEIATQQAVEQGPSPTMKLDPDLLPIAETQADHPETLIEPEPEPEPEPEREPERDPVEVRRAVESRPRPPVERNAPFSPPLVAAVALIIVVLVAVLASRGGDDPTSTEAGPSPSTTAAAEPAAEEPAEPEATAQDSQQPAPTTAAAPRVEGVPRNWVAYEDPTTGYTISHPPGWSVKHDGSLTDFRDPRSGAYLRVDYTSSPGPSAEQAWYDFEPRFAAENPNYRRIRIEPTTFKGYPAAIWEFTYDGRGTPLHAVDLGMVTDQYGLALNFQAPASVWDDMEDEFEAFKASFQPPAA
ncbi:MAG: protein kinase [Acidimicrobiales bacterium]